MGMATKRELAAALILPLFFLWASAANGGSFNWTFQQTGHSSAYTALEFRGDEAWPIIFSWKSPGTAEAAIASPTGWTNFSLPLSGFGRLQTSASPIAREIAVATASGYGYVGSSRGWEMIEAASVAYDSQGRLWATGPAGGLRYRDLSGRWKDAHGPELYDPRSVPALGVSSNGEIGLLHIQGYHHYSPLTGWTSGSTPRASYGDLIFDAHNVPHYAWGWLLGDFDVRTGKWLETDLRQLVGGTNPIYGTPQLAVRDDGMVATAVSYEGKLYFAWNDGDGWQVEQVPGASPIASPWSGYFCGTAFDAAGLPVIAYMDSHDGGMLAYDPAPEPGVLMFVTGALIPFIRRRRAA